MGISTIAVLVTVAFSMVGVLGVTTSSSSPARANSRCGRAGFTSASPSTPRPRSGGVRDEAPKAGHHRRSLLHLHGAASDRRRRGAVRGIVELL